MRLAIDHHYPKVIAPALRNRGHDVVTVFERGWHQADDEKLLGLCAGELRALMTNNVAHFSVLATDWATRGKGHSGLIFTSDRRMPRREGNAGAFISVLDALLAARADNDALADVFHWI